MNSKFSADAAPITLYRHEKSGHCHRVELMMALLDLPYETVELDMANGAHKMPAFLKLSPFGLVPAIEDNGITLSDSNAILVYLARRYSAGIEWLPEDPLAAAEVQAWLSVAAGEIANGPCAARLVTVFGASLDHEDAVEKSHNLFRVIDRILSARAFLAGDAITIADVAGYSYIAHAPEGGVSLDPYPAIRTWLSRIEALPNFRGMARSPLPAGIGNRAGNQI
ncbi:glutathione S-transferase [Maritimibacter sp. 55A14]|uniref:glutathione S-transferase family protein n=1 Tax=Maritimibacter sp. 55A14 TaxID=2174844 RepID=UPI000D61E77F|nr:glutathione S-transferase [Maritimibacter sp. 55A14]PWE34011.1 glutathione S-transferase [Maritimibacter sp. 55A14]